MGDDFNRLSNPRCPKCNSASFSFGDDSVKYECGTTVGYLLGNTVYESRTCTSNVEKQRIKSMSKLSRIIR